MVGVGWFNLVICGRCVEEKLRMVQGGMHGAIGKLVILRFFFFADELEWMSLLIAAPFFDLSVSLHPSQLAFG